MCRILPRNENRLTLGNTERIFMTPHSDSSEKLEGINGELSGKRGVLNFSRVELRVKFGLYIIWIDINVTSWFLLYNHQTPRKIQQI